MGSKTSIEACPDEALREAVPNVLPTDPESTRGHLDALGLLVCGTRSLRPSLARDFDELRLQIGGLIE